MPSIAQAKTTLVAVPSDHATINRLEALGLDVTYEGDDRTELMLHGAEDAQILADTGIATTVLDDDIDGENDAWLADEAAKQRQQGKGSTASRRSSDAADRPRRVPHADGHQHRAPGSSRRPTPTA